MPALTDLHKKILLELFLADASVPGGVERLKFRAHHADQLDAITSLESDGYIRNNQDRYRISLIGLAELDAPEIVALLENAEKLYDQLKKHYRERQNEPVLIRVLAERSDVSDEAARSAFPYMIEAPWYAGNSANFPAGHDAAVCVDEKVLTFVTFQDAIAELRRWKSAFKETSLGLSLPVNWSAAQGESFARETKPADAGQPDWHKELKEPLPTILREIYESRLSGHCALPAMGVRSVIDLVCTGLVGDLQTFKGKLTKIKEAGHLTANDCEALDIAFDAGSASAHRGYVMDKIDVNRLVEIMEHFLHSTYRLAGLALEVKSKTPPRQL